MAAAEARAAWQRMANRCIVQEDAKRAPKLACCPSSSSKLQPDQTTCLKFCFPLLEPMDASLPPDSKWWLQMQPNFGCRTEQLSVSNEIDAREEEAIDKTSEAFGGQTCVSTASVHTQKKCSSHEVSRLISASYMKHETGSIVEGTGPVEGDLLPQSKKESGLGLYSCQNEDLMNWKAVDQLISKNSEKPCFDMESPLAKKEKIEPWWRIADKDELASFVAKKSVELFENCDLPRPQRVHFCSDQFDCVDCHMLLASSLDRFHFGSYSALDYASNSLTSGHSNGKHHLSSVGRLAPGSDLTSRGTVMDLPKTEPHLESDPIRVELLEALCRSQTRAREAEIAAQRAHIEKEHIIDLFFKQASSLFAYRQWVQMLQLESLFLRLKMKDPWASPSLLPATPWAAPPDGSGGGGGGHRAKKRRGLRQWTCNLCRCAVALAVSLGLASTGLLFGWTLGWLLPIF
ncbi:unnamed protein product [Spirodela intermedia]|uniref:Uncharacterized protein n=1 Tax=Spirodela intermedia TaxID=51605 RepID=A0A7I8ITZ9_SPIIN|nr:unnamed protein product [Spirodela intermedia]CAA6661099.1 unnamed protein product [Spirodela intermedia]